MHFDLKKMLWNRGISDRNLIHVEVNPAVQGFPTLGNSTIIERQLPETPGSTTEGEGFWKLQSKNTWVVQGQEPLL